MGCLGLIAGGGQFPMMVAHAARERGLEVVAVAIEGETDPNLAGAVDRISWIKLGQLGRLIRVFQDNGAAQAIMAGTITKPRMFKDIHPDLKAVALFARMKLFHDDEILRALADTLAREGVEIVPSTLFLPELGAPKGCLTQRRPTREEREDIRIGWKVAKELGRLDVGQCVVVRRKTILAVEAVEGTNATIRRGGALAGERAVVVKVSKPHQDLRFDVPAVGTETIEAMVEVKAGVLAIEEGKTLLFDREGMLDRAERAGISVVSCLSHDEGEVSWAERG